MPVTRTSLPGGAVVAIVKRWRASRLACAPRSCAARSTRRPPRRRQHRRQREHGEQRQRRMDRHQQRDGDAEPQDPAARREHATCTCGRARRPDRAASRGDRDSPGRSWCAIVATDGLQPRDVRLERDRDPVAEAPLHAGADGAQEPGRRRRHAEPDRATRRTRPVAARARPCRAASATARAARRAAPRAATARTPTSISRGSCR